MDGYHCTDTVCSVYAVMYSDGVWMDTTVLIQYVVYMQSCIVMVCGWIPQEERVSASFCGDPDRTAAAETVM